MKELYNRKLELLEKMLEATSVRVGLCETHRSEDILLLTEARQAIMEKVDVLDADIKEFTLMFFKLKDEAGPGDYSKELAGAWEEVRERRQAGLMLVEKMQELDRQQKPRLELELSSLKKKQEGLRVSRQTVSAYSRKTSLLESFFIDKKK
ncbi:MAG: hypothetical protein ACYC4H_01250 [Desulfocucumaceae bacterium]